MDVAVAKRVECVDTDENNCGEIGDGCWGCVLKESQVVMRPRDPNTCSFAERRRGCAIQATWSETRGVNGTFTTTCVAENLVVLTCDLSRKPMW